MLPEKPRDQEASTIRGIITRPRVSLCAVHKCGRGFVGKLDRGGVYPSQVMSDPLEIELQEGIER